MDAQLTWELPTPGPRQNTISHVLIEGRLTGIQEWTAINTVDAPETSLTIQDIVPGGWEFRGTVVDIDDKRSPPLIATLVVPYDEPSSLVSFDAALV